MGTRMSSEPRCRALGDVENAIVTRFQHGTLVGPLCEELLHQWAIMLDRLKTERIADVEDVKVEKRSSEDDGSEVGTDQ